ncbi:MAG TPA: hypothetical protein VGG42_09810 [Acidobacteriaceae bacterium]|jgi:hypothetical protein
MTLAAQVTAVDLTRRRKRQTVSVPTTGNYVQGGDPLDLSAATNPRFLQGGGFGRVPGEWAALNAPGGYTAEFIPSQGGARTTFLTTAFTQPGGAGTALKVTFTPGSTVTGQFRINSAGGTANGKTTVNLANFAGLASNLPNVITAAAAALTAFLNAGLGVVTGSTYTVTVAAGVISITPSAGGSAGETLSVTASTVQEYAASTSGALLSSCAVKFFSADGTELAAGAYPDAMQVDPLLLELSVKMYKGM